MIIDTHAHLDDRRYSADLPDVIRRAGEAGVERIITVGIDLATSRKAVDLAESYFPVWAAVGVHPHDASSWDGAVRAAISGLLEHAKVVAVGETGLDFHRDRSPRNAQRRAFLEHLALAREHDMPVVIHARDAHEDALAILREHHGVRGVLHCFSGSIAHARQFIDLGMKLSLGGPLTYPGGASVRELFTSLPAEHFMVETDCPYLPPQSMRGKRNEPAMAVEVVEKMAELRGLTPADISRITSANARDLFGLGLGESRGEVAYRIRRSLYLNITNRCPNSCTFCRRLTDFRVKGHDLRLAREPSPREILEAVAAQGDFDEVVFCGYGEPLLRLDAVEEVARALKASGRRVRVNTNGLASSVHGFSVPERLAGLVDAYSVSLNAADTATYENLCRPGKGSGSFDDVVAFIREAVRVAPEVTATAVEIPGVDLAACRRLAESLGAGFRVRPLDEVG